MKILLTGAAGVVAQLIRPILEAEQGLRLRLTDIQPLKGEPPGDEEFLQGDLEDREFVDQVMDGVDSVIHLASHVGPDFTYEECMGANVNGTRNVFEAVVGLGIRKVVYASSHHTVGFLPRGARIDEQTPPRADGFYGISKAFGEILAAYYADRYGIDVLAIRIGFVGEEVVDERRLHTWCSARDLSKLILLGLNTPDLGYHVVYGVSKTPDPFFENDSADEIGYIPQDHSLDHLADPELAGAQPDPNRPEDWFIGGHFASNGFQGNLERLRREHGIFDVDSEP